MPAMALARLGNVAARTARWGLPRAGPFFSSPPDRGMLRQTALASARSAPRRALCASVPREAEERLDEVEERAPIVARFSPATGGREEDGGADVVPATVQPDDILTAARHDDSLAAARPYQREAIAAAVRQLSLGDGDERSLRARVILPSGTGKTIVGLGVLQALTKNAALVVVPRKAFVEQALRVYREHSTLFFEPRESNVFQIKNGRGYFEKVYENGTGFSGAGFQNKGGGFLDGGNSVLVVASDLTDTTVKRTINAAEIAHFLSTQGPKLVLTTYDSLKWIAEAAQLCGFTFDVAVFDEAHDIAMRGQRKYTLALDEKALPVKKRLFLTATPRMYPSKAGDDIRTMEDNVFGKEVYRMPFKDAADWGLVVPLKLVISNATTAFKNLAKHQSGVSMMPRLDGELALTVLDVCEMFGLKRPVSLHCSYNEAHRFKQHADKLFKAHWIGKDDVDFERVGDFSEKSKNKSEVSLNATSLHQNDIKVKLDLAVLTAPRQTHADVLEVAGRLAGGCAKDKGYFLLPIYHGVVEQKDYADAVNVLRAILEQDEALQSSLRFEAVSAGRCGREVDFSAVFAGKVHFLGFPDTESLQGSLSTALMELVDSWDFDFGRLEAYKAANGDCLVPVLYTVDGFNLGVWVQSTRRKYADGALPEEKANRLEALGFVWDPKYADWLGCFAHLVAYKAENGDCRVPDGYELNGFRLGGWVVQQRQTKTLTRRMVSRLEEIGFVWNVKTLKWMEDFEKLKVYQLEFGDCRVPGKYAIDGFWLGSWVETNRQKRLQLSEEKVEMLDSLGFIWDLKESDWLRGYEHLQAYKLEKGDCRIASAFETEGGYKLGRWVAAQRRRKLGEQGGIPSEQSTLLDAVGFVWVPQDALWKDGFKALELYKKQNTSCRVPERFVTESGHKLGNWVFNQRQKHNNGLSSEFASQLDNLGFVWDESEAVWEDYFCRLKAYQTEFGDTRVPKKFFSGDGAALGAWVVTQRRLKKEGDLDAIKASRLEKVGVEWNACDAWWEEGFSALVAYKKEHGDFFVPRKFETSVGFRLGRWVQKQRQKRNGSRGGHSEDEAAKLDGIGFI